MKGGLIATLRKTILTRAPELFPNGLKIRGPQHVRVARARNRMAAILRYAKNPPLNGPVVHPVTGEIIPPTQSTCHSCGRQFFHRPRGKDYQSNPHRKYCHRTCQNSRPLRFDRWLESQILKVLKRTHRCSGGRRLRFRVISTDSLENYILRHRGRSFRRDLPLHLTERIRQAARRLVGIPGRAGTEWKVIALEKNEGPGFGDDKIWIRRDYAPDRGDIMLGLVKADEGEMETKESSDAETNREKHSTRRTVNGHMLQTVPEWEGRYSWDPAGRLRATSATRTVRTQRTEKQQVRPQGWEYLLKRNEKTIEMLTARRHKEFGL